VGGGTVHYGAVSFRFRPEDFRARSYWGELPGADVVDWPFPYDELRSSYNEVERLIGVAGGQTRDDAHPGRPVPGAEWRTVPFHRRHAAARAALRAAHRPREPRPGRAVPDGPPLPGRDRVLRPADRLLPRLLEHALPRRPVPGAGERPARVRLRQHPDRRTV